MKQETVSSETLSEAIAALKGKGLVPARVTCVHRSGYTIRVESSDIPADASGKMLFNADTNGLPAVGDWTGVSVVDNGERAIIIDILPRKTVLTRRASGKKVTEQVIATNVDIIFIVQGLDGNYNIRRLERYLAQAKGSGAKAVVILTKSDLHSNDEIIEILSEAEKSIGSVPVHAVSSVSGTGVEAIKSYLERDVTICFIGSSGVGKSTLINRMAGFDMLAIGDVREKDGKGRHTTTRRDLIYFEDGSALIDTPGMREFGLWDDSSDVGNTFEDIEELGKQCRFADCQHETEPGCAILEAIESADIDPKRYKSYLKLQRELQFVSDSKREQYLKDKNTREKGYKRILHEHYKFKGKDL